MQPFYVAKKRTNNGTLTHTQGQLGDSPFHMHFECPAAVKVKSAPAEALALASALAFALGNFVLFCCFTFALNAIVCALVCVRVHVCLCVCVCDMSK